MKPNIDLNRFIEAQELIFEIAVSEIKSGKKQTHWMWYIFPSISNRFSPTEFNIKYGISSLEEAIEYYNHPILGIRLIEITKNLTEIQNKSIEEIVPKPDMKKLKASMTLFYNASNENQIFKKVLDKYFEGEFDEETLNII